MADGRAAIALAAAIGTGVAIALQATANGRAGAIIGPVRTGLMVNAIGGTIAAAILVMVLLVSRWGLSSGETVQRAVLIPVTLAGILGILIIVGISFSVTRVGVTAGLAAVIMSQLIAGVVIDRIGAGASAAIAIDARRVLGVIAMAAGVWLLIPRQG
jgi:uncharacterized membrane protein YdcZ (DUF606 family)